jgi:predicted XRE-type DNA-binding protein
MSKVSHNPDSIDIDITAQISVVRGQRVLFDADLATLCGVTTKRLNEQVRRNISRFPSDFLIQLTAGEAVSSRSQIAALKKGASNQSIQSGCSTQSGAVPSRFPAATY